VNIVFADDTYHTLPNVPIDIVGMTAYTLRAVVC